MLAVAPRSTWIHCGSLNALDQRVPRLPSTAEDAGKAATSEDDAVAGLPWDSRTGAAAIAGTTTRQDVIRVTAAATNSARRWRPGLRDEGIASPREWGGAVSMTSRGALSQREIALVRQN